MFDFGFIELTKFLLSTACGLIIGYQRESEDQAAGLRTHTLVALGATLITLLAVDTQITTDIPDTILSLDPTRILSAIISGIGFLGAGAIIQKDSTVKGQSTAATIWLSAAIGMAVGLGQFAFAIFTTILSLVLVLSLNYLKSKKKI